LESLQEHVKEALDARESADLLLVEREDQIKELAEHVASVEDRWATVHQKVQTQDSQLLILRKQLAEELSKRQALLVQIADTDDKVRRLVNALSSDGGGLALDIEKDREKISLQKEISDELRKNQDLQTMVIDREREICKLKEREVMDLRKGSQSFQEDNSHSEAMAEYARQATSRGLSIDVHARSGSSLEVNMPSPSMMNVVAGGRRAPPKPGGASDDSLSPKPPTPGAISSRVGYNSVASRPGAQTFCAQTPIAHLDLQLTALPTTPLRDRLGSSGPAGTVRRHRTFQQRGSPPAAITNIQPGSFSARPPAQTGTTYDDRRISTELDASMQRRVAYGARTYSGASTPSL